MYNPFFSVIIPTYNRAQKLKIALESLQNQTYKDFEVLVCDDGSTDNTKEIVEAFSDSLSVTYIFEDNWGGPARPRNNGLKAARGQWICFLDSDDWWFPNKLEVLANELIKNPKVDFICHDLIYNYTLSGKRKISKCGPIEPNLYRHLLFGGNRFFNSATTIKTSFLRDNGIQVNESKRFISVEDYELNLICAFHNANFLCINQALGEYTIETNNISASKFHYENLENVLKYHVFEVQTFEKNKNKLWIETRCRLNIFLGSVNRVNKNYLKSLRYYTKALQISPKTCVSFFYQKINGE